MQNWHPSFNERVQLFLSFSCQILNSADETIRRCCHISTHSFFVKDSPHTSSVQKSVTGTLRYSDPALDGGGLYYITDSNEFLLFKNEFPDYYSQYQHYLEFVDIRTRLCYIDKGETGCTFGMMPCAQQIPTKMIEVVKLDKE